MPSQSSILTDDLARARLTADAQAIIERYPVPR